MTRTTDKKTRKRGGRRSAVRRRHRRQGGGSADGVDTTVPEREPTEVMPEGWRDELEALWRSVRSATGAAGAGQ
jgi:hypothetical protein